MTTVTVVNTFHGTAVELRGALVEHPLDGSPAIRISNRQYRRALKVLCGIADCRCGRQQSSFEPLGDPQQAGGCDYAVSI